MVAKTAHRHGGHQWTKMAHMIRDRDALAAARWDTKCPHCGTLASRTPFCVDHIDPVSQGGPEFDADNLISICQPCNLTWGNKPKPAPIRRRLIALAQRRNRR